MSSIEEIDNEIEKCEIIRFDLYKNIKDFEDEKKVYERALKLAQDEDAIVTVTIIDGEDEAYTKKSLTENILTLDRVLSSARSEVAQLNENIAALKEKRNDLVSAQMVYTAGVFPAQVSDAPMVLDDDINQPQRSVCFDGRQ